jgi:peptidoglycan/LPS O-acetylase OafA/YrhL
MPGVAVQNRIQGLDLLRGVAILLVILRHSWGDIFGGGGIVGVVVFFTLSGYLITGLLVADLRTYGRVRYGRFYRNRAIRLLPALGALLVGFVIFEGLFDLIGTRGSVLRSVIVSLTYTWNIPGFDHGSPSISHLWTLANEEQFYLVWPLLLAIGLRYRKMRALVVFAAVALLVAVAGTVLIAAPADLERVYSLPTTWTISMVIGAAAQLGQAQVSRVLAGRQLPIIAAACMAGLIALSFLPDPKTSAVVYIVGGSLVGALTIPIIWFLRSFNRVPTAARPLLWLGTISYAAYLWNYPLTYWLRDAGVPAWQAVAAVLTIVVAAASWFVVEKPFNRLTYRPGRCR